jgi:hypothetical protein
MTVFHTDLINSLRVLLGRKEGWAVQVLLGQVSTLLTY